MLARLLHSRHRQGVAFIHLSQSLYKLGKFCRVERLDSNFHLCVRLPLTRGVSDQKVTRRGEKAGEERESQSMIRFYR